MNHKDAKARRSTKVELRIFRTTKRARREIFEPLEVERHREAQRYNLSRTCFVRGRTTKTRRHEGAQLVPILPVGKGFSYGFFEQQRRHEEKFLNHWRQRGTETHNLSRTCFGREEQLYPDCLRDRKNHKVAKALRNKKV